MTDTRVRAASLALLLVVCAVLAGCAEKPAEPKRAAVPSATFTDTTGGIEGFVVTPERVPIPGVSVLIVGVNATVNTTASGAFAFNDLEPQNYILLAQHPQFLRKQAPVTVPTGDRVKVLITLDPLPPPAQYIDAGYTFNGQIGFGACVTMAPACLNGINLGNIPEAVRSSNTGNFILSDPSWASVLFELDWEGSTSLADQLNLTISVPSKLASNPQGCNFWKDFRSGGGHPPVRVWLNRTDWEDAVTTDSDLCPLPGSTANGKKVPFEVTAFAESPPASAYLEQKFTLYITFSTNEPLSPDYTRLQEG